MFKKYLTYVRTVKHGKFSAAVIDTVLSVSTSLQFIRCRIYAPIRKWFSLWRS